LTAKNEADDAIQRKRGEGKRCAVGGKNRVGKTLDFPTKNKERGKKKRENRPIRA